MSPITKDRFYAVVLLVIGIPLTIIALAVSGLILFSGPWGLGHGFPILIFSIPILIIGVRVIRAGYRRGRSENIPEITQTDLAHYLAMRPLYNTR